MDSLEIQRPARDASGFESHDVRKYFPFISRVCYVQLPFKERVCKKNRFFQYSSSNCSVAN